MELNEINIFFGIQTITCYARQVLFTFDISGIVRGLTGTLHRRLCKHIKTHHPNTGEGKVS